jgi:predicted DNA-binding transcriptional regulator AlpA
MTGDAAMHGHRENLKDSDRDIRTKLVPLGDALTRFSLSRSSGYRLIQAGEFPLPVIKVGRCWFVRSADLEAFLNP